MQTGMQTGTMHMAMQPMPAPTRMMHTAAHRTKAARKQARRLELTSMFSLNRLCLSST